MPPPNFPGTDSRRPSTTARTPFTGNGHPGLRAPSMDDTAYILIVLVVLIPVVFTIILCTVTYCIYRRNKRRSDQIPTNSTDRSGAPRATIIYNTQHNPYIFEECPPAYDSLAEIKKDPHGLIANPNKQFPLTTLANTNEEVTTILPTAPPTPSPPPIYANIDESNKY